MGTDRRDKKGQQSELNERISMFNLVLNIIHYRHVLRCNDVSGFVSGKGLSGVKVTVIIPVYNQEKLVLRALDSIPRRKDIDVIVIDDYSTDKSFWSVGFYGMKNLNLIGLTKNQGVANARNEGLRHAIGEYVVFLDSDDYFYTKAFNECVKLLDGTDMVYYNLRINDGTVWELNPESKKYLVGCTKFIRRDFIGDTRFRRELKAGEDFQFNEDLEAKNPTVKYSNLTVYHYNYPRKGSLYDQYIKENS